MPNIEQLIKYHESYGLGKNRLTKSELGVLNEGFYIEKGFSGFDGGVASKFISYFEKNIKTEVGLLFIDIENFSKKVEDNTPKEIIEYLDVYYNTVIPIIYSYGGEVEKTIGDGIICVFGMPFLKGDAGEILTKTEQCCDEIISTLKDTDYEVKIALHYGEIMYYKNKAVNEYIEYTMIGGALTDLFRLESVSFVNRINYYVNSKYDSYIRNNYTELDNTWSFCPIVNIDLFGVKYKKMKSIVKS